MFSKYMSSTSNIITLNEIDDFLNDSVNLEVLKKHYKLWIESTGILQEIGNTNVFIDCETLLADIESEKNLFVKTSAFDSALKCLQNNNTLCITGNPGVGKTITSKMLVLHYAAEKYKVRFSTNVTDLDELKRSLSRNPDVKEIILVDDCFGQAYFNMKESQNEELLSLINYVNASKNKLLILNSRITILQEAKERKPELLKCFEGKRCRVYTLDMNAIDDFEKAKILYNHIAFNGMNKEYFAEIKKDKRYYDIIKHPNYTPRIIEFISNPNRYKSILPVDYYDFIKRQLNNPKEIWKDEYERRLKKVDRLLLLTLYSLSDSVVDEEKVKRCFEYRLSQETNIDTTINQYEAALSRLLDGFVQLFYENNSKTISMVNPSVNDYLDGRMNESVLEKQQLIDRAFSIQQKKRLLSENEFEVFIETALKNYTIEQYWFDSKEQKDAIITLYSCKHKIFDMKYWPNIKAYLNAPCSLHIYGQKLISIKEILTIVLQNDVCEFYEIAKLFDISILDNLLGLFYLEEKVEVICMIEHFFEGDSRDEFLEIVSNQLEDGIQDYCDYLDASDFDPDVERAIDMSLYFNGDYEEVDESKAAEYIEDEIISIAEDYIDTVLSKLPDDIKCYQKYTDGLIFSIDGVNDLINSVLADDCFAGDYVGYSEYEDLNSEIDYIFDR